MKNLKSENIRGFIVRFRKDAYGTIWAYGGFRKDTALDTDFVGQFLTKEEGIKHIRKMLDNVDIKTAAENKIPVVNAPTGSTASVAELAITHMLALIRFIPKSDSSMKKGEWLKKQFKGSELCGKTLGLLGSGNIAQHTAKLAKGFGMNVLVYSPHCTDEKAKKMGAVKSSIADVLKKSDFISMHMPHTKETHYLINKENLSLMKSSAYLINCSRGGTVDEDALYEALKNDTIAGAGIDVFETEPPAKENKLLTLD